MDRWRTVLGVNYRSIGRELAETVRSYHQVPEAKMLLQKYCAKGAVIFTLIYLKMKGAKVAHISCELHSYDLYFLNFHFGNVFVSAESTLKKILF